MEWYNNLLKEYAQSEQEIASTGEAAEDEAPFTSMTPAQ